jgi:putative tricarboxylic transport membrane protein
LKINDAAGGAALVALAGVVLWHIQGFPAMPGQKFGPAWFPGLVAAGLGLCGIALIAPGLRSGGAWLTFPEWIARSRPRLAVAAMLGGVLAYILLADALGFHLTAIAVLVLWARALGASWRAALIVAIVAAISIHLAFYKGLRVPLPWGPLERWAF